jgi:hypothetical protein
MIQKPRLSTRIRRRAPEDAGRKVGELIDLPSGPELFSSIIPRNARATVVLLTHFLLRSVRKELIPTR